MMTTKIKANKLEKKVTKRRAIINSGVDFAKVHEFEEAITLLKKFRTSAFVESVDMALKLGIDARKSDQSVRGAAALPHGTGKTVRVAVFAQGDNAEKAKAAGADIVGFEDLAETIKKGEIDFDVLIATPDAMRLVGQLGQILGPKGLMPNPKVGTVTKDVEKAITSVKAGQATFRNDKNGIIHCSVGKVDFDNKKIEENLQSVLAEVKKKKPDSAKGQYFVKLVVSTTMGPGITVNIGSLI